MAQQLTCDYCSKEEAALMMTSLVDGTVVTVGAGCLPLFFGGALLGAIGSDGHAGPPTKCQACRRTHERMTTPVAPLTANPAIVELSADARAEIEHVRTDAANRGDNDTVLACDKALTGDPESLTAVVKIIDAANQAAIDEAGAS